MIYLTNNKELYNRCVKLTNKEEKMLFLLASNEVLTFEELEKQGFSKTSSRLVKSRLVEKTHIRIHTIAGLGYRLDEQIYFG